MKSQPGAVDAGSAAEDFRLAMRFHAAGVAIVTVTSGRGTAGFTVSSLASLSLRPPAVSFNIAHRSSSMPVLQASDTAVIHLLSAGQEELARRFSGPADERFADRSLWRRSAGSVPVLHDVPVRFHVRLVDRIPIGDHSVVVCAVEQVFADHADLPASRPLVYRDGCYQEVSPLVRQNPGSNRTL
ncbi:flavin reductase family protein [Amycolatopsis sp., V23-08]|uniref:Flavin reductase family protein n=1 Tax=Amycolatopsis heterodermiae TaxID=3110235 RepID=A0ABU5R3J1_9PSEU|nr:flavin reductase family protein [Amycolatopsis sp., V23-08]MEA5360265.1 flavin reductase family protein [Amycolatopsis sp., V23-08]